MWADRQARRAGAGTAVVAGAVTPTGVIEAEVSSVG
jgi:hypothetical protein